MQQDATVLLHLTLQLMPLLLVRMFNQRVIVIHGLTVTHTRQVITLRLLLM